MEVPEKALPSPEGLNKDVTPEPSPVVREDAKPQEVQTSKEERAEQKGAATPERNLYAALEEERRMRREMQEELKKLKDSKVETQPEEFSDEGRVLKGEVDSLREEVSTLKEREMLAGIYSLYPAISEAKAEFDDFRKDYVGFPLERVARVFLAEKGLDIEKRKGLEVPTGGSRAPASDMTEEDLKRLRVNNPRRYLKLIQEGKI